MELSLVSHADYCFDVEQVGNYVRAIDNNRFLRARDMRFVGRAHAVYLGNDRALELCAITFFGIPHLERHTQVTLVLVGFRNSVGFPAFTECYINRFLFTIPDQCQFELLAYAMLPDHPDDLFGIGHGRTIDAINDIMREYLTCTRTFFRGVGHDQRTAATGNVKDFCFIRRQRSDNVTKARIAPTRRPQAQFRNHLFHQINRYRVPNPEIGSIARRFDSRTNTDHVAPAIKQGTARITWIDRGIGLQVRRSAFAKTLCMGNDATADRVRVTPQRITNREGFITGLHDIGISKSCRRNTDTIIKL